MSKGMRSPCWLSWPAYWLPATPPAGPESTLPAASRTASAMRGDAAVRLDDQAPERGSPAEREARLEAQSR